ncbi:MAG: hypothetical protein ABIL58_19030 [Pseudomonadota bacterium]
MAKVDKTLEKWRQNTPTDVPVDKAIGIIERFFPGQFQQNRTSHIVVQDDRLKGIYGYGPDGDFTVPVSGGQKVKGKYLKRLAETIKYLSELEEGGHE